MKSLGSRGLKLVWGREITVSFVMAWTSTRSAALNPKAEKFASEIKAAFQLDRGQEVDTFVAKLKPLFKECAEMKRIPIPFRPEVRCI